MVGIDYWTNKTVHAIDMVVYKYFISMNFFTKLKLISKEKMRRQVSLSDI